MSKQLRIQEILNSLKEGQSKQQIKNNIKEKYNVSDSTVDSDFTAANKLIKEQNTFDAEALKMLLNDRLECLYGKALIKNDINTALKVLNEFGKLNGLYVEKQQVDLNNDFQIVF